MTPILTLFHYWRSSSSLRVRWALEVKGLKAQMVHVHLLTGESESDEHLKRNPLGHVPVLKCGNTHLIESVAIIEWLEELVPHPKLYPGDLNDRAHIRSLVELINSETQPLQNVTVLDLVSDNKEMKIEWAQKFIRRGLKVYQQLCTKTAGQFSVGDSVTAADIFLIPQMANALRFEVALEEFPLLKRIYENAHGLDSLQAALPDKYKPAEG